ncbi:DUF4286 family protein [Parabacteroides sp. Marseille-P3160]|jgi:hypothetical protein|uniref:DUF4286 family protein n=1 Tax=Parabacteroides sp. Marseille-P3160 TaxID=1917887 RepID=UPI0009B981B0|nr:DUF4286 family protein [Parabacteroides sp. Marseille-P3160]
MIIYNITFHIEQEVLTECLEYLKTDYIPKASGSGFLTHPALRRILTDEEEVKNSSFSVQFQVKNVDTLQYWLETQGRALHQKLISRFGNQVVGFSTLLEDITLGDE